MSTEAKNWAADQHPGRPLWKLVLLGTCNYVSKHTGKTSAHPETVAEWCNIHKAQTVSDTQGLLAEKGFLVDTGERIGRNGQTIVWAPGWPKHSHATDTALTPNSHRTDTKLTPRAVASDTGEVGTEPITDNHEPRTIDAFHTLCSSLAEGQRNATPLSFLVRNQHRYRESNGTNTQRGVSQRAESLARKALPHGRVRKPTGIRVTC